MKRMKILLIFPPYSMKERYNNNVGEDIGGHLPPLGLCYIAAVLEEAGHEVRIMDCPTYKQTQEDVVKEVVDWKPEIVGLAAVTILIDRAVEITKAIKAVAPKTLIVIGGPHPTQMPEDTLRDTGWMWTTNNNECFWSYSLDCFCNLYCTIDKNRDCCKTYNFWFPIYDFLNYIFLSLLVCRTIHDSHFMTCFFENCSNVAET